MRPLHFIIALAAMMVSPPVSAATAEHAALLARHYVGTPYRYGGASPAGFDCSGLVQYVYAQVGVEVPRTVRRQIAVTQPVPTTELQAGDLLFFRLRNGRRLHVGIYVGNNLFVHAPSRGKRVSTDELTSWWQAHLTGAGRVALAP